jgi:hypothetical protein
MRFTMRKMRATMAGAMAEEPVLPFPLLLVAASLLAGAFGWIVY